MSLLLEARKKSQEALAASGGVDSELSLEPITNARPASVAPSDENSARSAGQNLFRAKLPPSSLSRPAINRSLMYAAGGTLALLAAGGGYVWYAVSDSDSNQPLNSISQAAPITRTVPDVTPPAISEQQVVAVVETVKDKATSDNVATPATKKVQDPSVGASLPAKKTREQARSSTASELAGLKPASATASVPRAKPIRIEPQLASGSPDSLLNRAYAAYRDGKLDEAQRLYLDMVGRDAHNSDALLGLAAIAQQRNEDRIAAQYYLRVLNLDPRNAVANAGMSALSNNENYESRLKTLLREQGNSAALHFALGNLYAEQSRWSEAQQAYFNAYSLDAKNADLAFNLAVSLDHLGQSKLAAQHYQQALQLDQSRSANFDRAKISSRIDALLR